MSTLRVNITLEKEPGVATAHIRLGNRWAKATLRNVSKDQLLRIAMGDNEVLSSLLQEAKTRGEAWVKYGPKNQFVKMDASPHPLRTAENATANATATCATCATCATGATGADPGFEYPKPPPSRIPFADGPDEPVFCDPDEG